MGRKPVIRQDISCPSCGSHHVVKSGRSAGRQKYLCRDCGKYFLGDASYYHHSRKLGEEALKMYANGMSMRAISRVLNVSLGIVFTWIKRYGRQKYEELVELWGKVKDLVKGKVIDEIWTYLFKNIKAFCKCVFTCFVYTSLGLYVLFSVGDRGEKAFKEILQYAPEGGRWVSDDYNVYFSLRNHTVVKFVNPNESLHSSLRDRLVRFKRATKTVSRSLEIIKYSLAIVLWERKLIPEFVGQ